MRIRIGVIAIIALFCAAVCFAAVAFPFSLNGIDATRKLGFGLLFLMIALAFGVGGWAYTSRVA